MNVRCYIRPRCSCAFANRRRVSAALMKTACCVQYACAGCALAYLHGPCGWRPATALVLDWPIVTGKNITDVDEKGLVENLPPVNCPYCAMAGLQLITVCYADRSLVNPILALVAAQTRDAPCCRCWSPRPPADTRTRLRWSSSYRCDLAIRTRRSTSPRR
jgi:hypothetical protein